MNATKTTSRNETIKKAQEYVKAAAKSTNPADRVNNLQHAANLYIFADQTGMATWCLRHIMSQV